MPRYPLIAVLALALALIVPRAPWSDGPGAQPQRAAISRTGVLGGADYRIACPRTGVADSSYMPTGSRRATHGCL